MNGILPLGYIQLLSHATTISKTAQIRVKLAWVAKQIVKNMKPKNLNERVRAKIDFKVTGVANMDHPPFALIIFKIEIQVFR